MGLKKNIFLLTFTVVSRVNKLRCTCSIELGSVKNIVVDIRTRFRKKIIPVGLCSCQILKLKRKSHKSQKVEREVRGGERCRGKCWWCCYFFVDCRWQAKGLLMFALANNRHRYLFNFPHFPKGKGFLPILISIQ